MPTLVPYFQMHQPPRLRRYSVFDTDPDYFDDALNRSVLTRVAEKCYRPMLSMLRELAEKHEGGFRFSLSVTGVLLDQLGRDAPDVLALLASLGKLDGVEFLNETSHHSLAFLYSRDEFKRQVEVHAAAIEKLTGQVPTVFRNTELIYSNELATYLDAMGRFRGVLAEGVSTLLQGRSPHVVYRPPHAQSPAILLRDYGLSDDIGFRFSDRNWPGWPLTPGKFAASVGRAGEKSGVVNVFLDMESFGEHQKVETGIFDFLQGLPQAVLDAGHGFATVSQALEENPPSQTLDCPRVTSWADTERDLSAWVGNAMQSNAIQELYKLETPVKSSGDAGLIDDWRKLTVSDHCYYMCTKYFSDMAVHNYFNPYESPYDSYINFMNVLDNLRRRTGL